MACKVPFEEDWEKDPWRWRRRPRLCPTSVRTGSEVSALAKERQSPPSPGTSLPSLPLDIHGDQNRHSFLFDQCFKHQKFLRTVLKHHRDCFFCRFASVAVPRLSCPMRNFLSGPMSTASTVNSSIIPRSNLFLCVLEAFRLMIPGGFERGGKFGKRAFGSWKRWWGHSQDFFA